MQPSFHCSDCWAHQPRLQLRAPARVDLSDLAEQLVVKALPLHVLNEEPDARVPRLAARELAVHGREVIMAEVAQVVVAERRLDQLPDPRDVVLHTRGLSVGSSLVIT